ILCCAMWISSPQQISQLSCRIPISASPQSPLSHCIPVYQSPTRSRLCPHSTTFTLSYPSHWKELVSVLSFSSTWPSYMGKAAHHPCLVCSWQEES
uniref:Uncharacterized protein n=1 Tax=Gopherus agassizii TaxID=38772 RepID=A0A452I9U4_9SAUR